MEKVSTERIYIKTDRNGTKHYRVNACPKCDGTGYVAGTSIDGSRCWKCQHSGYYPHIIKEYTPEYIEARNKKAAERLLADNLKKLPQNIKHYTPFISMDNPIYAVKGDTYSIRGELRSKGARWNWGLYTWVFDAPTADYETVEVKFDDICELNEYNVPRCKEDALRELARALKE